MTPLLPTPLCPKQLGFANPCQATSPVVEARSLLLIFVEFVRDVSIQCFKVVLWNAN